VFEVRFLAEAPEHVDQLARWHHNQWAHLYADWTLAIATEELQQHVQCRDFPTTLIVLQDNQVLGSASLIAEDAEEFDDIGSPWLASVYVQPEFRGRGLGALLVKAVMRHAKKIQLDTIYLFTPDHHDFYVQLGWEKISRVDLHHQTVDIMKADLRVNAALTASAA
jgi:N-acetylglutamate synthase-like GNAT family acetyltransferase